MTDPSTMQNEKLLYQFICNWGEVFCEIMYSTLTIDNAPTNFNYVLNEVPGTGCSVAQACQDRAYLLARR